ncbi:hypothetical protein D3C72_1282840 [compost metagenome]
MFHHQDRAPGADALDQLRDAVHVFVPHALSGLVKQHQFGFHGQRRGDFQRALAAIRQVHRGFVREGAQVHLFKQRAGGLVQRGQPLVALPEVERQPGLALQADAHVLKHGQVREHRRYLERTDDAAPRDLRGTFARNVDAVELDGSRRGR